MRLVPARLHDLVHVVCVIHAIHNGLNRVALHDFRYLRKRFIIKEMAACDTNIDEAIDFAAKKLVLGKLKEQQVCALQQFVSGHDIFINLPTGFGKSVIFQAATVVLDFLNADDGGNKALVIVVVPLKALAVDQLDRARQLGIEAADITSHIPDCILEEAEKFSILFASPESLCSTNGRALLRSVRSRCYGLFVDESHCVSKW